MAITLASISKGAQLRAPRIVLLGVEKIGKTSFAAGTRFENGIMKETGLNNPIVIPCRGEEGADSLDVPLFPTCNSPEEVMEAIGSLYNEDHEFRTVVLDSASALNPLIMDSVCREFKVDNIRKVPGFRTGEAAVLNLWRELLGGLDAIRSTKGMASIVIGHIKVKKFKNPEGDDWDCFDFDLEHPEIAELLKRWADVILFANTKVVVKKEGDDSQFAKAKRRGIDTTGGTRFLYTQKRPAHPGGGRGVYGQLPYELPLDWSAFESAVAEAAAGNKTNTED